MSAAGFSAEQYAQKAHEFVEQLQPELAAASFAKALEQEPGNHEVMTDFAALLLDLGDFERAGEGALASILHLLLKSIQAAPDEGPAKYLYLAQLRQGGDAVQCFDKGIALLERDIIHATGEKERKIRSQIASALASVAEIYMSDLCMEPDAEQQCEARLAKAAALDPGSVDVAQATASMRISQQRLDDANAEMTKALRLLQGMDDDALPAYGFRVMTAKYLLELDRPADAVPLFDRLLAEDDTEMEVWFLMASALRDAGEHAQSLQYLDAALESVRKKRKADPDPELAVQEHQFEKLRAEVASAAASGAAGDMEEEDDDDDDDDGDE